MRGSQLLSVALAIAAVHVVPRRADVTLAVEDGECTERGADGKGGCIPCKPGTPKGFPFTPCPVDTSLHGTLKLGGDVDKGRMTLSIDGSILNDCKPNDKKCQKATLDVKNFVIDKIYYEKGKKVVDQRHPPTSPGCDVCDIKLTYPKNPNPPPPPPKCKQCQIPTDLIAALDVSKSMSMPKGNPSASEDLVKALARRFKIGPKFTRFALTTFGDDARIEYRLQSPIAANAKLVYGAINQVQFTNRFSNHASAIDSAVSQFRCTPKRKVPNLFVLYADGKPNKDVRRIEPALRRLRCQPHTCFAVVAINAKEHSEEEAFFRYLLGCAPKGKCPQLFLVTPTKAGEIDAVSDDLRDFLCKCAKNQPRVPYPDAVTTFTIRVPDKTLSDFGDRDELNRTVDEMLYNAAEATGVTPDRLTAIAIEDTLGNAVGDDFLDGSARRPTEGDASPAVLVEAAFEDAGLNDEPASQEAVRRLSSLLAEKDGELRERLAERGIVGARIERMAIRQNEGNMPILDVLQV